MNKRLILFLVAFVLIPAMLCGQEVKAFEVPEANNGHLSMKANRGDMIEIKTDSAFVLSSASFYAYRLLRNELLKQQSANLEKLELIKTSLSNYMLLLKKLDNTIKSIDDLSNEHLAPIIENLSVVNEKLIADLADLKELNEIINEKATELEQIEKKLKWYRFKKIWFKFADWVVAGAVGFAVGAIVM